MKIVFHKNFEKQFQKFSSSQKDQFQERLRVFCEDQFNSLLNNHPLRGRHKSYRSINITGDLRAIYKMIRKEVFVFVAIDNHSNLYS